MPDTGPSGRRMLEPASGAWSSPVMLVWKKDQSWRFFLTTKNLMPLGCKMRAYLLPCIDESLETVVGSRYFTTLDLTCGYWEVPLDADAQEKSTFATRSDL